MINMGRDEFLLAEGDVVITLLAFKLGEQVDVGYNDRAKQKRDAHEQERAQRSTSSNSGGWLSAGIHRLQTLWNSSREEPAQDGPSRRVIEMLSTLAPDFLQVEKRAQAVAEEAAEKRVRRASEFINIFAVVVAVAAIIVTIVYGIFNNSLYSDLSEVRASNAALEASNTALEQRIDSLEERLSLTQQ
jgi:hypothetical protein